MLRSSIGFVGVLGTVAIAACSSAGPAASGLVADRAGTEPPASGSEVEASDSPIAALSADLSRQFREGDALFELPLRSADGLGPLFTQDRCSACHTAGGRGPGLVEKMSVMAADGLTPSADQSMLPFGDTVHPQTAGGGTTPVSVPLSVLIRVTTRVGPPVLGRGYMEAVQDSEIERLEALQSQRTDAIRGRINWVTYGSEENEDRSVHAHKKGDRVIGRFGLKARIATLDDFTADAFQGDMGITSPLRPSEIQNPDGLTDDAKPGVDVGMASINKRTMYMRLLAIPARKNNADADADANVQSGVTLFDKVQCAACHAPSLKTRADYPIGAIAGKSAAVYTDFLLHDMGAELADSARPGADGTATHREWRTAPLIGLRFFKSFLHDGRANTVPKAIAAHRGAGSQANVSVDLYDALSAKDRQRLDDFVSSL
jgi:CxxC motif-containing protein (DUF1111 family)